MGLRITTWNVNGIRNPFQYQPWRDKRSFEAMFDILEADIVILQEIKIQRKDLDDGMVLVPGWDCFFSLPRHKKGYSGVVIYTRQSVCAPIRAEEGISGILCPPNSTTSFSESPEEQKIGGYPTFAQLVASVVDAATLDSEGRCVILEFPAFVLLGVYSPANRDETRDDFRLGFLNLLDARIRNLVAMGKRVFLTGDLNISREELDTANAETSMRKNGMNGEEYASTPARRLFNQLLEGGKVFGGRDEGRETPVMWDICRAFHSNRKGMFTCWEQKVNARPGNCGARIDYVLCSLAMKDWFSDSNIQEGLMGSDHCPVYAVMKDKITINGQELDARDIMNPSGMFSEGKRHREYSRKEMLPSSGKLIPEFDRRRNIGDMFARKPSLLQLQSTGVPSITDEATLYSPKTVAPMTQISDTSAASSSPSSSPATKKRSMTETSISKPLKRAKSGSAVKIPPAAVKGQKSLKGFFKPKASADTSVLGVLQPSPTNLNNITSSPALQSIAKILETRQITSEHDRPIAQFPSASTTPVPEIRLQAVDPLSPKASPSMPRRDVGVEQADVHDPVESKESWSRLFTKPAAPRCEGHNEPCITLLTKKTGMNCGRSFWMCSRPLGPTGAKEKNTQWRCQTFIWCSDWNPNAA